MSGYVFRVPSPTVIFQGFWLGGTVHGIFCLRMTCKSSSKLLRNQSNSKKNRNIAAANR